MRNLPFLKSQEQVEAFISGVMSFYNSLNPINWDKYVNFTTKETEDNFEVTFSHIVKTYINRGDPRETPEDETAEEKFTWHKFNKKQILWIR